jgi:hypothetical protein
VGAQLFQDVASSADRSHHCQIMPPFPTSSPDASLEGGRVLDCLLDTFCPFNGDKCNALYSRDQHVANLAVLSKELPKYNFIRVVRNIESIQAVRSNRRRFERRSPFFLRRFGRSTERGVFDSLSGQFFVQLLYRQPPHINFLQEATLCLVNDIFPVSPVLESVRTRTIDLLSMLRVSCPGPRPPSGE